uniref:Uncharacterized protein n=1 Tax=Manihot esculenta TaxID=3983 RepID=A0A2C9U4B0_MANES
MPTEEGGVEKVGEDIPSPEYGRNQKTFLHSSVTWDETTRLPESTGAEVHFSRLPLPIAPRFLNEEKEFEGKHQVRPPNFKFGC